MSRLLHIYLEITGLPPLHCTMRSSTPFNGVCKTKVEARLPASRRFFSHASLVVSKVMLWGPGF